MEQAEVLNVRVRYELIVPRTVSAEVSWAVPIATRVDDNHLSPREIMVQYRHGGDGSSWDVSSVAVYGREVHSDGSLGTLHWKAVYWPDIEYPECRLDHAPQWVQNFAAAYSSTDR